MGITYGAGGGWVRVEDSAIAGVLYLRVADDGRVTELAIHGEGRELTPAGLRRLPTVLARRKAEALLRPDLLGQPGPLGQPDQPDPNVGETLAAAFPDRRAYRQQRARQVKLKPPGPDGLTDDFLRDVARAYNSAVAFGQKPNQALADQTGTRTADGRTRTVESWVYLSRKRGFLAPARGRK